MKFNPAELPEVDAVDVVSLEGIGPSHVSTYMRRAVKAPHVRVADELAQEFADLWRRLPESEQARCHVPPYGLRFYRRGELLIEASVCWQCNNIVGDAKGEHVFFTFDAGSEPSQKLLSLCRQVFESRGRS